MNAEQRQLLEAIAQEARDQRGPVPLHLVPIMLNVVGAVERDRLDGQVAALIDNGLLVYRRGQRAGLAPTPAGLEALFAPAPKPREDREHVEAKTAPALHALLCDLAGLVANRLADDALALDERRYLADLGGRILEHTRQNGEVSA